MRAGRREEMRAGLEWKRMHKSRIVEKNNDGDNGIGRVADTPGGGNNAVLTMPWTSRKTSYIRLHA